MTTSAETTAALTALAREDSGRVLAILANRFGDVDLADEAVQDALARAAERWETDGVPDNPAGWLMTVARRIAIDRLRSADSARRRTEASATEIIERNEAADSNPMIDDTNGDEIRDDRLRMVLLCCHPALHADSQTALTLRLVGGLTTEEIASAFLVPTPTLAQRISRAKRKIRDAAIPLSLPSNLDERLGPVLDVLYLTYNEGYLSRGEAAVHRVDLCEEAIRLTQTLVELVPDNAEVLGLLSLMLFHETRQHARFTADEDLVRLEDQNREAWSPELLAAANAVLRRSMQLMAPGPFQVQAHIAALHTNAPSAAETDWARIAGFYAQLETMTPTPVIALNRSVAIAMANGADAGLRHLEAIDGLDDYHLWHSTRGHLLDMAGRPDEARVAFTEAMERTSNPAEQRLIERRLTS